MMWSLVLYTIIPMQSLVVLGEIGYYTAFNKCVYAQNLTQSSVTAQDPNGLLLCVKNFKNTSLQENEDNQ